MRTARLSASVALVCAGCVLAGCAAPVVTLEHVLPAAVPLPQDIARVQAGGCSVNGATTGDYADFASERLRAGLEEVGELTGDARDGAASASAATAQVTGVATVNVKDTRGVRRLRRRDPKTGRLEPSQVATLVRVVDVSADFVVTRAGGERLVTVETRRSYNSVADPRTRGELGLGRPDDPERVPPAETVVKELLADCVGSFCSMLEQYEVTAQVKMRLTLRGEAGSGLASARKEDYRTACRHFKAAAQGSPDSEDILFNLAVAAEAAGDLEAALESYERVVKLTEGQDVAATEGALRARRVLERSGRRGRQDAPSAGR